MAAALNTALRDAMKADDSVVVYGEAVGRLGGVFRITDGLQGALGDKRRYWMTEDGELPVTKEPIGRAVVRRPRTTAALIAYGPMVSTAREAAASGEAEGWDLEVADVRPLSPRDIDTLVESVTRTRRS